MRSTTWLVLCATIIMILAMHLPADQASSVPMTLNDKVFYLCWSSSFVLLIHGYLDKTHPSLDFFILLWCRTLATINFLNELLPWFDPTKQYDIVEYIATVIASVYIYIQYKNYATNTTT